MCGICGFQNLGRLPVDRNILTRKSKALAHRGPDDSGSLIDGPVALILIIFPNVDEKGGRQEIIMKK